jgi:hypothetical protein
MDDARNQSHRTNVKICIEVISNLAAPEAGSLSFCFLFDVIKRLQCRTRHYIGPAGNLGVTALVAPGGRLRRCA